MILTVLADNRTISFSYFAKEGDAPESRATLRLSAIPPRSADEYAALLDMMASRRVSGTVQCAIVASVVPTLTPVLQKALCALYGNLPCLTVGAGLRTGLTLQTDSPGELGADLVAMAVGASMLQKPPFLVLNCGDITTLSAVAAGKDAPVYLGCAILPGTALCASALKGEAALLSTVAPTTPTRAIGKNTTDSIRAGIVLGHAAAIDRLITNFENELETADLPVIATGDEAELILPLLQHNTKKECELAHKGLWHLARINEGKTKYPPKRG